MALLSLQSIRRSGTALTFSAATAGGDTMPVGRNHYLHVKNGGAGAVTVTVAAARTCDQGFSHDVSVSVPAGGERVIGPIDAIYAQAATALASITYSGVTSVTVAAVAS